ncbi:MAG: transposase [Terriglobia bacterium]
MALGKRTVKQSELFVPVAELPKSPAHPFYSKLNALLADSGFDGFVENLCEPYYKEGGRPSIPPGIYFRMLFIGYFEGIDSQRGIAWRCADSRSLREFLGADWTDTTPAHNSMTVIRQRLPAEVFEKVFDHVLQVLRQKGLLKAKTLGIDSTTLEANAAMKAIVRKADGKDWKEYLRALAKAEGIENPTEEDLRRIDRGRKDKKVSNQEWESPSDPDSRIARMKNGTTRLAYKAEHAVDLESEAIVAAQVTHANRGDTQTGLETLILAQTNLVVSGSSAEIAEVVKDKGYHDNRLLAECARWGIRTYIPERKQESRTWADKPEGYEAAFRGNRRRVRRAKGRRLNRWRSERCERSFAHVCETGGGRRAWLRGLVNVTKSYLMRCAGYNLGLVLRKCFGLSKPRSGGGPDLAFLLPWVVAATWVGMITTEGQGTILLTGALLLLLVIASATAPFRPSLTRWQQNTTC